LKQVTNWQAAGFLLTEDACNGKEALSIIEKELPQLIITDLSMPVMDGISLIKRVREISSNIGIVVLSCHDEFEYVKEAMRLGADEYILKNLLDEASLLKILETVRVKINKSAEIQQQKTELQRLAKKGTELMLQELLVELTQIPYTLEKQKQLCSSSGIDLQFRRCAAVIAAVEQTAGSILQPICEQFCRNKDAVCFGKIEQNCYMLIDLSNIHSQAEQRDHINTFSEGMKNCIADYLNAKAAIGVSSINSGDGGIYTAISQAKTALDYRFYGYRIYRFADLPVDGSIPDEAELSMEAFAALRRDLPHPNRVREWFFQLSQSSSGSGDLPDTLEGIEQLWLSSKTNTSNIVNEQKKTGNRTISQAVTYIQKHFHEPISLSQVAADVHLNATYLSYLFKQEMGINFSDYLTNLRLARIKELLHGSNQSIKDCAATAGFQDYRNFCKLFKKETGMRPAEYRNLKK
ncbi:MAG: helix-turn-helix domain-containing protein, partial [Bacillota bacterium]